MVQNSFDPSRRAFDVFFVSDRIDETARIVAYIAMVLGAIGVQPNR